MWGETTISGKTMRSWSIPFGEMLGISLRIHFFFLLLLGASLVYTNYVGLSAMRGLLLWVDLLAAVMIREVARSLVAVYSGLEVRSLLLLPIGGLFSFATPESSERASEGRLQTRLSLVGCPPHTAFLLSVAARSGVCTPELTLPTARGSVCQSAHVPSVPPPAGKAKAAK